MLTNFTKFQKWKRKKNNQFWKFCIPVLAEKYSKMSSLHFRTIYKNGSYFNKFGTVTLPPSKSDRFRLKTFILLRLYPIFPQEGSNFPFKHNSFLFAHQNWNFLRSRSFWQKKCLKNKNQKLSNLKGSFG